MEEPPGGSSVSPQTSFVCCTKASILPSNPPPPSSSTVPTMGFNPTWFSRLTSSSKTRFYSALRAAAITTSPPPIPPHPTASSRRILSWSLSLIPIAATAALVSFDLRRSPSLCDAALDPHRIGGKGSTVLVVRGSHKDVPREFIQELKAICDDNITVDYDERYFHGKPQNSFHKAVNVLDVVVYPRSQLYHTVELLQLKAIL